VPKHQEGPQKDQLQQGRISFDIVSRDTPASKTINTLHFIMAHSKEHSEWAVNAKAQLIESLQDLAPWLTVSIDQLLVAGTQLEIMTALAEYQKTYTAREADKTLILTPGWWESQMVVLANANGVLPYKQFFCLPGGEPSNFLRQTLMTNTDEAIIGGVYNMAMPSERYVQSIIGFRPHAKKVCIVYDPATSSDILRRTIATQVSELQDHFALAQIEVVLHHWTPEDMNVESLRRSAYGADSVVILNEPATAVHKRSLIGLCNAWNIFVCSSELDSVMDGAVMGCGVTGASFGIPLAALIVEYLFFKRGLEQTMAWSLHRIPEQSGMRFNQWAFHIQGVKLSRDREELIYMKSVFDPSCIEL
jgi:hypothetical protein